MLAQLPKIVGIDIEHTLDGGYDVSRRRTTGCHMISRNPEKLVEILQLPDKNGVFKCWIKDPNHQYGKSSTFFPLDWTEKQICDALAQAVQNIYEITIERTMFRMRGISKSGIKIEWYLNADGIITLFYPLLESGSVL